MPITQSATAFPTEQPAELIEMLTEEPAPVPPPTDELVMLRANPWQWVSFSNPTEGFEVENPTVYRGNFQQ